MGINLTKKKPGAVRLILLLVCMCMAVPVNAGAASKKSKALKAYKNFLAGQEASMLFTVAYVNNDSVPELICGTTDSTAMYTWKNSTMKTVKCQSMDAFKSYYKKKGIIVSSFSQGNYTEQKYGLFKGTTCTVKMQKVTFSGGARTLYWRNGGEISLKKFNSLLKSYVGSKKVTKLKYYKNTAANRRKYLK